MQVPSQEVSLALIENMGVFLDVGQLKVVSEGNPVDLKLLFSR